MSKQPDQHPSTGDRDVWRRYWRSLEQPWRVEPEIVPERQAYLRGRLEIVPNVKRGIYPFKNIRLTRADIEWLLAEHEDRLGPINWSDKQQRKRLGLDLRGALLNGVDTYSLPLSCIRGGLSDEESRTATYEECEMAAIHLEGATLYKVHLEGAVLNNAYLEDARLAFVSLEYAELRSIHLKGATLQNIHLECINLARSDLAMSTLSQVHLEKADLSEANLSVAKLWNVHLERADLSNAKLIGTSLYRSHLEGANLNSAVLQDADFYGSYLESADLRKAHLENAYLGLAHLEGADLQQAHLEDTRFEMSHLEGTILSDTHLQGADFKRAYLGSSQLSSGDVERLRKWIENYPALLPPTNFERAFCDPGTNFEGVYLGSVDGGYDFLSQVYWSNTLHTPIDDRPFKKMMSMYQQFRKKRIRERLNPSLINQSQGIVLSNLLKIPSIKETMMLLDMEDYENGLEWIESHFFIPHGQWIDTSHDPQAIVGEDSKLTSEYLLDLFGSNGMAPSDKVTIIWIYNNIAITLNIDLIVRYVNETLLVVADDIFIFDPQNTWCFQLHHEGKFYYCHSHRLKINR